MLANAAALCVPDVVTPVAHYSSVAVPAARQSGDLEQAQFPVIPAIFRVLAHWHIDCSQPRHLPEVRADLRHARHQQ